jgi:hypothetical protein
MTPSKLTLTDLAPEFGPEAQATARTLLATRATAPDARVTPNNAGGQTIKFGEPEDIVRAVGAMGITDLRIFNGLMAKLGNALSRGREVDEGTLNFALGLVKSIKPRSDLEALLVAQMAVTHLCAMEASRHYMNAGSAPRRDSAERALNKLTRTFALQMETLKRTRQKAQQVVRVERVTVADGGQAIVGTVTHGGGEMSRKSDVDPMHPAAD